MGRLLNGNLFMKSLLIFIAILLFAYALSYSADKTKTVYNPYTHRFDFIVNVASLTASDFNFSIGGGSTLWQLDANNDLEPVTGSGTDTLWEIDADGDLRPL